ncbi:MAG: hypothetical protein ACYCZN_15375 [Candidatus Dormibacteria bacterium]
MLPGALPAPGRNDRRPLEPRCSCPACDGCSRAHLRHLHLAGQLLAHRLVGVRNLHHLDRGGCPGDGGQRCHGRGVLTAARRRSSGVGSGR